MSFRLKCPKCKESFEVEDELWRHLALDHLNLSEKPKGEYSALMHIVVKADTPEEAQKILEYILSNVSLPKIFRERIMRWTYRDEAGQPMIDDVIDIDWTH